MVKIDPTIFREYDIRGTVGKNLTKDMAQLIGQAFATHLKNKGITQIVVGRDNRLSSEELCQALTGGILQTGSDVIDLGLSLSPIVYYATGFYLKTNGGVEVTGSHLAPEFNGFKLVREKATIYGDEIKELEKIIQAENFAKGKGKITTLDAFPDYLKMIKEKIKLGPRKLKVVLDCGNGTAGPFTSKVLEELGVELVPLYCDLNGRFPHHNPDPTKIDYMQDLIKKVKEEKADLGLGIDGDGDRLGAVDEKGNIIWGDQMMILFSREILKTHPRAKIIIEVKCSQALYEDVLSHGGKPIWWKTGHSLIKAKMSEENALLTGEMSGHMFFADEYYGFDDALYAAGRLLRILTNTKKSLSECLADAPQYYSTPEIRPYCSDKTKFQITAQIVQDFKEKYGDRLIDVDGARVVFDDGWGLVRTSNTQPALIIRAEGKTKQALERVKKIISAELAKFKEIKLDWEKQGA